MKIPSPHRIRKRDWDTTTISWDDKNEWEMRYSKKCRRNMERENLRRMAISPWLWTLRSSLRIMSDSSMDRTRNYNSSWNRRRTFIFSSAPSLTCCKCRITNTQGTKTSKIIVCSPARQTIWTHEKFMTQRNSNNQKYQSRTLSHKEWA